MKPTEKRRYLIAAGLLMTLLAAAFAPQQQAQTSAIDYLGESVGGTRLATKRQLARLAEDRVVKLKARRLSEDGIALFNSPPAQKGTAVQVAVSPTMPPLPFRFIGKMTLGKTDSVLLAEQNNTLVAVAGETLLDTWRVDSMDAQYLRFTYLPLATTAVLRIGEAD